MSMLTSAFHDLALATAGAVAELELVISHACEGAQLKCFYIRTELCVRLSLAQARQGFK